MLLKTKHGPGTQLEKAKRLVTHLEGLLARSEEALSAARNDQADALALDEDSDPKHAAAVAKRIRQTVDACKSDVDEATILLEAARQRLTSEEQKAAQAALQARWASVEELNAKRLKAAAKVTAACLELAQTAGVLAAIDTELVNVSPVDLQLHGIAGLFGPGAIGALLVAELARVKAPGVYPVVAGVAVPAFADRVAEAGAAVLSRRVA